MAGYSGTPLVKKLGVKEGVYVLVPGCGEWYNALLGGTPKGVHFAHGEEPGQLYDIIHVFIATHEELWNAVTHYKGILQKNGALWVS